MASPIDVATEDNLQYQFFPVPNGCFEFKVRAPNDAHIALASGPQEADPMVEVFIGGWGNTKSVIRLNRSQPEMAEAETPGILNAGEFRGFMVRWDNGVISAVREGESVPFLVWENPEPFFIGFVGVCTGWGATGTWKIAASPAQCLPSAPLYPNLDSNLSVLPAAQMMGGGGQYTWLPATGGEVPPGAVQGGEDNGPLYIARASHEGAILPGKLVPGHGVAYVPWGGAEHGKTEYEVLCGGSPVWVPSNGSNVPSSALPGGQSEDGEPLFVGRVQHEGSVTTGKFQPSHGVCYIPYGGKEMGFPDFEVLVANPTP